MTMVYNARRILKEDMERGDGDDFRMDDFDVQTTKLGVEEAAMEEALTHSRVLRFGAGVKIKTCEFYGSSLRARALPSPMYSTLSSSNLCH
ncbi:hypothetical protein OROMI_011778 [Orobanche minor]